MMTIGDRVKEVRKRYGLSQEKFAEKLNTYRLRVVKIEAGTIQPSFQEIVDMCDKFNADIEYFIPSKPMSTQDFKKISERYINNEQLSYEERRETIEYIYISLAQNKLKSLYNENVTKNNKYYKNAEISNKIDMEKLTTK